MNAPLITIGIACYNAEDTMDRAIEGALRQEYENFEIVIVDDRSGDKSFDILQKYAALFPDKIRAFQNEINLGVAGTRNRIIKEARGEFLAFFDDDDDCLPTRLKIQYMRICSAEQDFRTKNIICFGSGKKIYPNGYEVHFKAIGSEPMIPMGDDLVRYHLFMNRPDNVFFGSGTPSCSMMARVSIFSAVGGFDGHLRRIEDSDLCIRLGLSDAYFVGCPEKIIIQYASEGSDKNPQAGYDAEIYLIEKYRDYLSSHHLYDYAKDWILVRFYHFSGQKWRAIFQIIKMAMKYPVLTLKRSLRAGPRRFMHEWKMNKNAKKLG